MSDGDAVWIYDDANGRMTAYADERALLEAHPELATKLPEKDWIGRPMNGRVPWHMSNREQGWSVNRLPVMARLFEDSP